MICEDAPESKSVERFVLTTQASSAGERTSSIDENEKSPGRLLSTDVSLLGATVMSEEKAATTGTCCLDLSAALVNCPVLFMKALRIPTMPPFGAKQCSTS